MKGKELPPLPTLPSAELIICLLDCSESMTEEDFHDPDRGGKTTRGQGVADVFNYLLARLAGSSVGEQFLINVTLFAGEAKIHDGLTFSADGSVKPYIPWAHARRLVKHHGIRGSSPEEKASKETLDKIKDILSNEGLLIEDTTKLKKKIGIEEGTDISGALAKAREICQQFMSDDWWILPPEAKRKTSVILLTDGEPTINEGQEEGEAMRLKNLGARVITIGIGEEVTRTDKFKNLLYSCASAVPSGILAQPILGTGMMLRDILYRPPSGGGYRFCVIVEKLTPELIQALRAFLWSISGGART